MCVSIGEVLSFGHTFSHSTATLHKKTHKKTQEYTRKQINMYILVWCDFFLPKYHLSEELLCVSCSLWVSNVKLWLMNCHRMWMWSKCITLLNDLFSYMWRFILKKTITCYVVLHDMLRQIWYINSWQPQINT